MENLIRELKQNPMFNFSLGSKELFHSNFWMWLSDINPVETAKLFDLDIEQNTEKAIFQREKNLKKGVIADFYIKYGDQVVVIENKIKDYPYVQQLIKEKEYKVDGNVQFILITLIPYNNTLDGFKQITYSELAVKIIPSNFSDDSIIQAYIKDYVKMISKLSEIIPKENCEIYDFAVAYHKFDYLTSINFGEVYQKYRASHFCQWIRDKDKDCTEITSAKSWEQVDYYSDYSLFNKSATINIFKKIVINNLRYIWAGVQIQNTQFRVMIHGDLVKNLNIDDFCETLWNDLELTEKQGRNNSGCCKFGNTCKYRHREITRDISYEELHKEINCVLNAVEKIDKTIYDW